MDVVKKHTDSIRTALSRVPPDTEEVTTLLDQIENRLSNIQDEAEKWRRLISDIIWKITHIDTQLDLDQILYEALKILLSIPEFQILNRGSIFLLNSEWNSLDLIASENLDPKLLEICKNVPFWHCFCWKSAELMESIFRAFSTVEAGHDVQYPWMPKHWHYCVPIILDGDLLGLINLYTPEDHVQDPIEVNVLNVIAWTLGHIIAKKNSDLMIEDLVLLDDVTWIANEKSFLKWLDLEIRKSKRSKSEIAVLSLKIYPDSDIEIDQDKQDILNKLIASSLSKTIRDTDSIWYPGDWTFLISLGDIESEWRLSTLVQTINDAISKISIDNQPLALKSDIWISSYPDDWLDWSKLIEWANKAREKNAKCDMWYSFFGEDRNKESRDKHKIYEQLKEAIEKETLEVYFQPQVDIQTWNFIWVEVLVRWPDWKGGFLHYPDKFIPIAEEFGLIIKLDKLVMKKAIEHLKNYKIENLPYFRLAFNVTAEEFTDENFVEYMRKLIEDNDIDPKYIELELTERMVMDDIDLAIKIMNDLKALWIRLAIDDFWIDKSSLASLKYFPVDVLKVDKKFVDDIETCADSGAIMDGIIKLWQSIHLTVLAEWVERKKQLDILIWLGCNEVQWYYYWKPMSPTDFKSYIVKEVDRISTVYQERIKALQAEIQGAIGQFIPSDSKTYGDGPVAINWIWPLQTLLETLFSLETQQKAAVDTEAFNSFLKQIANWAQSD